jgi:anti-sigma factor RsiW
MQRPTDEQLIAYLDGETDAATSSEVAAAIARDPALAREAEALRRSATALRAAFDDVLREPLPERLVAACRGEEKVIRFPEPRPAQAKRAARGWREWASVAAAAAIAGLVLGGTLGYFLAPRPVPQVATNPPPAPNLTASTSNWLDNAAGYYKMFVNSGPDDRRLVDIPANPQSEAERKLANQLPQGFRTPNLQPWGLVFVGARLLFIEGRAGAQLFYTTDNKALGPITVVVASTAAPDLSPTFDRRGDLNVLYWRHGGHMYAILGTPDIGYLWNIHNDLAWQFDAI